MSMPREPALTEVEEDFSIPLVVMDPGDDGERCSGLREKRAWVPELQRGPDAAPCQHKCQLPVVDDGMALEGSLVSVSRAKIRLKHAATRLARPTVKAHTLEEGAELLNTNMRQESSSILLEWMLRDADRCEGHARRSTLVRTPKGQILILSTYPRNIKAAGQAKSWASIQAFQCVWDGLVFPWIVPQAVTANL